MKCSAGAVRKFAVLLIAVIAVIVSGCASHQPPDMTKGIVACCYESKIGPADGSTSRKIPVSLRISAFHNDPEESHVSGGAIALAFIPLISLANLASPSATSVNFVSDGGPNKGVIKKGEVEQILKQEIRKSGLVRDVSLARESKNADYEIRGSVNFKHNRYVHNSGLGILYIAVLPMFTLPSASWEALCMAHFDVVSKKTGAVVLSKDYSARRSYAMGLVYDGVNKSMAAFGKEVFPEVVEKFIADMRAMPKNAWKR
jgi:hypothetical protein